MSSAPTEQHVAQFARRMFKCHGDGAVNTAREIVAQLRALGGVEGAGYWLRIIVTIEELRRTRRHMPR